MRASQETQKTRILLTYARIGDPAARALVELSFAENADAARRDVRLPALYAEYDLVKMLLAQGALGTLTTTAADGTSTGLSFFDWKEADVSESGGQRGTLFAKLLSHSEGLGARIAMIEARAAGNRGGAVGEITRKAPVVVPDDRPHATRADPNAPEYRGDALRRSPKPG